MSRARRATVLALLAVGAFAVGASEFSPMAMLPAMGSSLGVPPADAALVVAAYSAGAIVGGPVVAAITGRWSRKRLVLVVLAVFAGAHLLCGGAAGFVDEVGARFVAGLPHGAYFGVASAIAVMVVPAGFQGRAIGVVLMGSALASTAGVPAASWLGALGAWRLVFAALAVIAIVVMIVLIPVLPRDRRRERTRFSSEVRSMMNPASVLGLAVCVVGFGGTFTVLTFLHDTLTSSGVPGPLVPVYFLLFGVGMVLGNLVGGRLADWNRDRAIVIALVYIITALLVLAPSTVTQATLALGVLCLGGTSVLIPPLQSRVMHFAPAGLTLAGALIHSSINIANGSGALLAAALATSRLGLVAQTLTGAGLALAGLVVYLATRRWSSERTSRSRGWLSPQATALGGREEIRTKS
jgi:DHA1 family inner membrane transport protein